MLKGFFDKVHNLFTPGSSGHGLGAGLLSPEKENYLEWERQMFHSLEPNEARREERQKKLHEIGRHTYRKESRFAENVKSFQHFFECEEQEYMKYNLIETRPYEIHLAICEFDQQWPAPMYKKLKIGQDNHQMREIIRLFAELFDEAMTDFMPGKSFVPASVHDFDNLHRRDLLYSSVFLKLFKRKWHDGSYFHEYNALTLCCVRKLISIANSVSIDDENIWPYRHIITFIKLLDYYLKSLECLDKCTLTLKSHFLEN